MAISCPSSWSCQKNNARVKNCKSFCFLIRLAAFQAGSWADTWVPLSNLYTIPWQVESPSHLPSWMTKYEYRIKHSAEHLQLTVNTSILDTLCLKPYLCGEKYFCKQPWPRPGFQCYGKESSSKASGFGPARLPARSAYSLERGVLWMITFTSSFKVSGFGCQVSATKFGPLCRSRLWNGLSLTSVGLQMQPNRCS